jgi:hypothetical protein
MAIDDLPALRAFWPIVATPEATLAFLICHRILWIPTCCSYCSGPMSIQGKNARCIREGCRKSKSLLLHSIFGILQRFGPLVIYKTFISITFLLE